MISAQEAYDKTELARKLLEIDSDCLEHKIKLAIEDCEYSVNIGENISIPLLTQIKKLGYKTEWTPDKELIISWGKTNTDKDFESAFNGSSNSLPFEDNDDYDERFEYISKALDNDMLFYEQFKDKIKSGLFDVMCLGEKELFDMDEMIDKILKYFEEV